MYYLLFIYLVSGMEPGHPHAKQAKALPIVLALQPLAS